MMSYSIYLSISSNQAIMIALIVSHVLIDVKVGSGDDSCTVGCAESESEAEII